MENQKFSFSDSFQKGKEYIDTQIELLKLKAVSRVSRLLGSLILDVSKVILLLMTALFLSLALAFFLGEIFQSYALGFLATAGIFLLLVIIIRLLDSRLEVLFTDIAIRKVMNKWNDDDDDEGQTEKDVNQDINATMDQEAK